MEVGQELSLLFTGIYGRIINVFIYKYVSIMQAYNDLIVIKLLKINRMAQIKYLSKKIYEQHDRKV